MERLLGRLELVAGRRMLFLTMMANEGKRQVVRSPAFRRQGVFRLKAGLQTRGPMVLQSLPFPGRHTPVATEKATGLVLRTTDWSETSRIATLWTREFGKVRALAKGGRRLRSNFESALDLLTVCSIVLLRKTSGGLDLLTEAQVVQRFPRLSTDLPALYAGYYVAELLSDWTEDYDPHPRLFDEARKTLQALGTPGVPTGPRHARRA